MDLRQIQYIVAIAEENNITRAAEKLYITQSALNQQLLKLEKELGVQLFHRSRTDWHPTEAGEIYLKAAREMLLQGCTALLRLPSQRKYSALPLQSHRLDRSLSTVSVPGIRLQLHCGRLLPQRISDQDCRIHS